jgi:hypothetical protein
MVEGFPDGQVLFDFACRYKFEGVVLKRLASRYTSGPTRSWLKVKDPASVRGHAEVRRRLFEKPPSAPSDREKTLARRRVELARVQERLAAPGLRAGLVAALKAQERTLLQEIAELNSRN